MTLPATAQEKKTGLAYWANRVLQECDKASLDFAPDPVHDLRVAIRRCRSMADGFISLDPDPAWKQMKKLGKPLFASLGDLRDTQVMSEWVTKLSEPHDTVRHTLLQSLQQKEAEQKKAAEQAVRNFDRRQWTSLNDHLAGRTGKIPLENLVFQYLALERWNDAYQLHHQALRNRSQVAYHQLRIGIKRFRYTVENFLPDRHERWARDLRDLQDALGEVHDFDVLWAMIKEHPELPIDVRSRWRARILEARQKRLDFYRGKMLGPDSLWRRWRAELPSGQELDKAVLEKLKTWASLLDPDFEHSALVRKLALEIYDGLAQHAVINVDNGQRRMLEAAALLHEIGRAKGGGGHHKRTYRMIRNMTVPLGWNAEDLRGVAVIARYHRGALAPSSNALFAGMSGKRRAQLLRLAGILRLANAFDSSHEKDTQAIRMSKRNGALLISGGSFEPISATAERLARSRYLLEATCGIPITIESARISRKDISTRVRVVST